MPGGVNGVCGVAICPGIAEGGMPIGGGTMPAGGGIPPGGAMPPGGGIPPMGGAPPGAGGGIWRRSGRHRGDLRLRRRELLVHQRHGDGVAPPPSCGAPCIGAPMGGICWG